MRTPATEAPPLLEIHSIRIAPNWSHWRERKLLIDRIELETPKLTLTPQALRVFMPKVEVNQPPPPDLAANTPPQPSAPLQPPTLPAAPEPTAPTGPVAIAPVPPAQPATTTTPATPPPAATTPPAPAAPPKPVVNLPTSWLVVRNGEVHAEAAGTTIAMARITGEVPIGGQQATGKVSWQSLQFGPEQVEGGELPVQWNEPAWRIGPWAGAIHGVRIEAIGEALLQRGLPMQWRMLVPKQPWQGKHDKVAWKASFCEAQAVWSGYLQAPATWSGRAIAHAHAIDATCEGKPVRFDDGIFFAEQRGPIVQVRDARLIGDELSLLGNGIALSDGRFGAVLRTVSPREQLGTVREILANRLKFPADQLEMRPLQTPDRWFFDLKLGGTPEQILLQTR